MTGVTESQFFDEGSPYLVHPLLTSERTAAEVDAIAGLVASVSGRILDIGCGFGRHSIELASRGADVTGIDPSATMVAAARERAAEAGQFVDFQCIAASDFNDVARYDLAICLFTTLGQLEAPTGEDEPHLELLHRAKRALRPGAALVLEVPDKARAVPALVENEMLGSTKALRCYDPRTSVIGERFVLESGDAFNLTYRVFDKTELVDLLHDAGFVVESVLDHGLATPPPTFMTVVARRPA